MTPLNIAYFNNKLRILLEEMHTMTEKEMSRELACLADKADKDAGLFLLQGLQIQRGE